MHKITQRSRPHTQKRGRKKILHSDSADYTLDSAVCHQISNDHICTFILFFLIDVKNSQFANKDVWGKKLALLLHVGK